MKRDNSNEQFELLFNTSRRGMKRGLISKKKLVLLTICCASIIVGSIVAIILLLVKVW